MTRRVMAAVAGIAVLLGAAVARASSASAGRLPSRRAVADSVPRTTLAGVFTLEQAARGKDIYLAQCQSCHAAITHTGPVFRRNWSGRALADLYTFVSTRMPKSDPASLSPESYADLLAYVLQMNRMPAGTSEIAPDITALQRVRIQLASLPKRKKR